MQTVVDASEETADNVNIISESDSGTSDTEMVKMEIQVPKEKWDCESILSKFCRKISEIKSTNLASTRCVVIVEI